MESLYTKRPIHIYRRQKKGQSENVSKKLACIVPLFARPSATEFASRYMRCRWTTHSLLRSILQLEIMENHSEAKFPEEVRHVRTKVKLTLTFKNLIPMFQAVIKPCLTAPNSAHNAFSFYSPDYITSTLIPKEICYLCNALSFY